MPLVAALRLPATPLALTAALEGLTAVDYVLLRRTLGGGAPPIYQSGVVYRRERGREDWRTVAEVLVDGYGDCEDLAAWRAAELRTRGEPATAAVYRTPRGSFHAVVKRADGTIEDPSKILLALEARKRGGL